MKIDNFHSTQNVLFNYTDILHCHHKKKWIIFVIVKL